MLNVTILTPDRILFEGEVESVFLPGDTGEFEILEFHKPIISLLRQGNIVIDWKHQLSIKSGVAKVKSDSVVVIVEE